MNRAGGRTSWVLPLGFGWHYGGVNATGPGTASPIPAIDAVPATHRWSVMIPAYNCAELLERTIESVLASDLGPDVMHIEVVDDGSNDDPQAVVARFNNRVRFWRQPSNVGAINNFNTCIDRSRGEYLHILHGDDIVKPGFYEAAQHAFGQGAGAFVCRAEHIDENDVKLRTTRSEQPSGLWLEVLERLTVSNRVVAACIAMRRSVYEDVGGFSTALPHAADWEMWTRVAAGHPVWFEDRVLGQYREHAGQDTSGRVLNGENIRERRAAIDLLGAYVNSDDWPMRRRKALGYSALYAVRTAAGLARSGEASGAAAQVRESLLCLAAAVRSDSPR